MERGDLHMLVLFKLLKFYVHLSVVLVLKPSGFRLFNASSNKNIKMCSFKSSENIQTKEGGLDRSVSDKQSSSVTLNERAMKARTVILSFSKEVIH